ncbi:hypothetical protein ACHAQJ_009234 [Trichoderma viride]
MGADSGERFSAEIPYAGNGVSTTGPDLTTVEPEVGEAAVGPETRKLDPSLDPDEAIRLDRASIMERMEYEWESALSYAPEWWAPGAANNDGADPAEIHGDPALGKFPEDAVCLGYPRTTEQAENYWRLVGVSNGSCLHCEDYVSLERSYALSSSQSCSQEIWFLHHVNNSNIVHTGAVARPREGLISTTKGGAKIVRAMVISQLVTNFESRMQGYATHFLKLLAEELDKRKGKDRIAFSVVYSGPNTEFFHMRG